MILLIDNVDSFTHNLAQQLSRIWSEPLVVRNDCIDFEQLDHPDLEALILSPGPGRPGAAGDLFRALDHVWGKLPVLGICLGCQAIGERLSARLVQTGEPLHGKTRPVTHNGLGLFTGLPNPLIATRYHSLALDPADLDKSCLVDAWSGEWPMAIRQPDLALYGLQFHPESFMTPDGDALIRNFYHLATQFNIAQKC